MYVCVFSRLFLCPLFYASNPILSLYNTPKVSKIKHPFSVFTVLFCQFSSPNKATDVHVFPLSQHISWNTRCVALDSRRRRKCLKYFQHACYTTFPVYLGKLVFLSLLYVFLLSVNSISVYIFFALKAMLRKRTVLKCSDDNTTVVLCLIKRCWLRPEDTFIWSFTAVYPASVV